MPRGPARKKGFDDELHYHLLEIEFREKQLRRRLRNQDRKPKAHERGMFDALKTLKKTIRRLRD